jgi:putative membrane protein
MTGATPARMRKQSSAQASRVGLPTQIRGPGGPSLKINPRHALVGLAVAGSLVVAPHAAENALGATIPEVDARSLQPLDHSIWGLETRTVIDIRQGATDNDNTENDNGASGGGEQNQAVGSDQEFLMTAASGSATEIEAGRLAQERSSNRYVRQFGERLTREHQEALRSATNIARSKGLSVPQSPATAEQAALIADLSSRSGQDFDRAYLRAMVDDHRADIDELEAARVSLSSDVGSFVARQLPTLRDHLAMAEELAARVSG